MKSKFLFINFFLFVAFFNLLFSQNLRVLDIGTKYCGWNENRQLNEIYEWETDPDDAARKYINLICEIQNIQPNFIIRKANVSNALSLVDSENQRVIYYSSTFFKSTESEWFKIAILAHEIGHFLNYHNFSKDRRQADELIADEYAGFILGKLKAPINEVMKLIDQRCETEGTEYYPPKSARAEAVQIGYDKAIEKEKKKEEDVKRIEDIKRYKLLEELDCSALFRISTLKTYNFDEKDFVATNKIGLDLYGVDSGALIVAPQSYYYSDLYDPSKIYNYEIEFQISFDYSSDRFNKNIPKEQYFIWDAGINDGISKGYYFTIIKEDNRNKFELGYLDGNSKLTLEKFYCDDVSLFLEDKFLTVILRKFNNNLYLFVDNKFIGKVNIMRYLPGLKFILRNDSDQKENSRGEVYLDQLTWNRNVKLNYLSIKSLSDQN